MAGRIPRDFIDDLLDRTDIVSLVDARVKLKKAGRNYQACCPFHNEKSPSFTVSPDKQFYHCFGCGAHGNAISFLMEYDRLEFPEAVEDLASFNGLEVPREKTNHKTHSKPDPQQKDADFQLMEEVAKFFQYQLRQHQNKSAAVDYLKNRGLSGEICQKWGIGYAPPEWNQLLSTFAKNDAEIQRLLDLKLINKNDSGRTYDFFRDRIMFPIRNQRGKVIGFGGRILGEGTPKYLNSPETRLFHKGRELFGFNEVRNSSNNLQRILVVEGYMDVVALSQFDINYAVAALGTATTPEHIQALFRNTNEVVCCYDGDNAGREAAWRAMENALPFLKDGSLLKFLFLPDGEDPDTFVRSNGKAALENKIKSAIPVSQFIFEKLKQKHHLNTEEGKAAFKAEMYPLLEKISTADNLKELLQTKLDSELGYQADRRLIEKDVEKANSNRQISTQSSYSTEKAKLTPIRLAMTLLLENPALAQQQLDKTQALAAQQQLDNIQALRVLPIAGMTELIELITLCITNKPKNAGQIIEHFRGQPMANWLAKISMLEHHTDSENQQAVFNDIISNLFDQYLSHRQELLLNKQRIEGELSKEEKQELRLILEAKNNLIN